MTVQGEKGFWTAKDGLAVLFRNSVQSVIPTGPV